MHLPTSTISLTVEALETLLEQAASGNYDFPADAITAAENLRSRLSGLASQSLAEALPPELPKDRVDQIIEDQFRHGGPGTMNRGN